ncbi:CD3337/EF1877 family mobilome membrane protein [Bacillus pumilus]|uniref:CD3337/EF1877 family mobilome membrane protein n=1 Tax=Bacillus pumilus TaxID=1408 RepID=UPI003D052AD9
MAYFVCGSGAIQIKRKIILVFSIVVILLTSVFSFALADDKEGDKTVKPKVEKVGGVGLEISRFPLEHYQAHNEAEDGMIKGTIVSLSNVMLGTTQIIVLVVDKAMDLFMSAEPIENFSDAITSVSKQMYNVLKKSFGEIIFVFLIGFLVYLFLIRGNFKDGMRRLALFFLVMIVAGLWVNKAGYWVESLNALSIEGQGKLINVGNKLVDSFSGKTDSSLSMDDVKKGQELKGTTAVLRNFYFDAALKSPYLVTNYGTPNEKTILKKGNGEGGLDRIDTLLSFKLTSEGQSAKKKFINDKEVKEYKNQSIAEGSIYAQLGYSFIGLLAAISLGVPFFLIPFLNFLIQIIVLAIALFLPMAFILSYVPQFAYSGFVSLGRMLALFVMKAMLTFVLIFVYAICVITNKTIPPTNLGMYFLNVAAISAILIVSFLKRDKIIKFVTAGKVQSLDANLLENTRKSVVQPSWEGVNKVGGSIGEWKKKHDAKKAAEERKKAEEEQQYSAERRSAPQNQSTTGNSKFDRTSQDNFNKGDLAAKKEVERKRQLAASNQLAEENKDNTDASNAMPKVDVERSEQLAKDQLKEEGDSNTSASNVMPKVDVERSEQLAKDQLKEEGDSNTSASNVMPKVDVERSEQLAKDQLKEEGDSNTSASNVIPKVDVERNEQLAKDQLKEEGDSNTNASNAIPKVDVERSDQIKEHIAEEEKTNSPKGSTSAPKVDVERSDQGVSEKTLTEESISNQKTVSPVPANVARNEQTQSKEKVRASVPKTGNETVEASDAQPKVKRVIQQQPKHVKIELDQIESRQSKNGQGDRS